MDTNPGVLLLGTPADRSRGQGRAAVQLRCDARVGECGKRFRNEHKTPLEVVGVIWQEVPDFAPTAQGLETPRL